MPKKKPAPQPENPQPENAPASQAPATETSPRQPDPGGPAVAVASPAPVPTIGDVVFYCDGPRWRSMRERNLTPDPIPAIVTRINRDKTGAPDGRIGVCVMDPELGPLPRRDLPYSETLASDHWTLRPPVNPRVPLSDLVKAVEAVMALKVEDIATLPPID